LPASGLLKSVVTLAPETAKILTKLLSRVKTMPGCGLTFCSVNDFNGMVLTNSLFLSPNPSL